MSRGRWDCAKPARPAGQRCGRRFSGERFREQEMTQPRTLTHLRLQFKPHAIRSLVLSPCHTVERDLAKCLFAPLLLNPTSSAPQVCSGRASWLLARRTALPPDHLSGPPLSRGVSVRFSSASLLFRVLQEAAPRGARPGHSCVKWGSGRKDQQGRGSRHLLGTDATCPKHGHSEAGGTQVPAGAWCSW